MCNLLAIPLTVTNREPKSYKNHRATTIAANLSLKSWRRTLTFEGRPEPHAKTYLKQPNDDVKGESIIILSRVFIQLSDQLYRSNEEQFEPYLNVDILHCKITSPLKGAESIF